MSIKLPTRTKAFIAMGLTVIVLSFSGFYVRWADAPGPITSLFRMAFTAFFLTLYILKTGSWRKLKMKQIIFPLLAGCVSAMDHYFWSSSLHYTSIANAIMFNYIAPIWVACVAFFIYKEKLSKKFWLGLGLTMLGIITVFGNDLLHHPRIGWGDTLAALSSFFYAGYFLISQHSRKQIGVVEFLWLVTLSATAMLSLLAVINGQDFSGYNGKTILVFIAAALFAQLIGYLALSYASGHLPASLISPTMILQPILTSLLAVPISHEPLTWQLLLAAPLVFGGIYLVNRNPSQ
jgi:drug/metabolite transporter (DMT)-like permease